MGDGVWEAVYTFVTAIYQSVVKTSRRLMSLLATAIGDCELFSVITEQASWTFSKGVHNNGLGNVEFLIFLLFLVILHRKTGNKTLNNVYLVLKSAKCFI
ncbi:TPA_asm: hypothetical protein GHD47_13035 [Listeria monocytogenes]|nr:hypothetical protein CXL08_01610 [Listeria monocytogenes]EAF4513842.1 hypothetical protein [Listeria monocytogenes serotype 1/2a]EEW14495.1 conserved hypothetical protein [Listeria monocytogenes FSL N3-165]AVV08630.1 hypothetical protein CXL09_01580 [Listeria monocytogenes]EAA0103056.1 hypothetical protein [Listeria monocytogenes]